MNIEPATLRGSRVVLEPMRPEHLDEIVEAGLHPELWQFTVDQLEKPEDIKAYVEQALASQVDGSALPFVTKLSASDKIVGSTRFGNIDAANRKTEIGWTWVTPEFQRSFVNTEAKLLMLTHAFETWKCIRVEFKTDALNARSRAAILRLGAREEGTLRNHMITATGRFRDSVYFSILESEWPAVKNGLLEKLGKHE